MRNYFLAPRSGEKSYKNFESTIKNGIPLDRVANFLDPREIEILAKEDVIYAWGNREGTKSAWKKMQNGDLVIFYAKGRLVMTGEVYFKKHDPKLALAMWPPDDKGNPWEYTFFLKSPQYISIPIKVFNAVVHYKQNSIIQGFKQLKPDRIAPILAQYGTVEKMLALFADANSEEIPLENDKLYVNVIPEAIPTIHENIVLRPNVNKSSPIKHAFKKKIDYAARNQKNSIIGSKGEELVLKSERERLINAGKSDLAKMVKRVSIENDTLGYDILSFELNGTERHIEVKTSSSNGANMRFYVSSNEYVVGKKLSNYFIYFVENVDSVTPKITIIQNPIDDKKFSIMADGYIFEAERKV